MVKRERLGGSDESKATMVKRERLGVVKQEQYGGSDECKVTMVKQEQFGGSDECKVTMVKQEQFGGSDECKSSVDRISALSDKVLGLILSLLTLKEATATSILSSRWKYLWTLAPKLDFDGTELLGKMRHSGRQILVPDIERCNFVRWVDRVVAGCCSSTSSTSLEEFRVYFDLTRDYARHIDEWLSFAVARKVQRLELNFANNGSPGSRSYDQCYTFPYNKGNFPNGFSFIKKLSTHYVNVNGEALELFLGNCPLLEQVSVSGSGHLKTLHVSRTFASFKCLEISCCFNLTSLVVRDSNVESIKYGGKRIPNFQLINVPLLTEIWIGGVGFAFPTKHVVEMFSCVFPQLQMLKIYFFGQGISWKETEKFMSTVEMCNLKQLVVNTGSGFNGYDYDALLPLINLIDASPNLQRFVLEAPSMESRHVNSIWYPRATRKISRLPHQLKEVEFVGYHHGEECEFKLIRHLVENFVRLENIVVDTRGINAPQFHRPWDPLEHIPLPENKGEILAAKEQLNKYVPSKINMKII